MEQANKKWYVWTRAEDGTHCLGNAEGYDTKSQAVIFALDWLGPNAEFIGDQATSMYGQPLWVDQVSPARAQELEDIEFGVRRDVTCPHCGYPVVEEGYGDNKYFVCESYKCWKEKRVSVRLDIKYFPRTSK